MKNIFGNPSVSKEKEGELNFNERVSKLEKRVAELENQVKELTERQFTLIQAVGILCMKDFQKEK